MNKELMQMSIRIFLHVAIGILVVMSLTGCSAIAAHHQTFFKEHGGHASAANDDPISGNWEVTFHVHDMKMPGRFSFKVEGTKVTGTAYSEHTGSGTIRDGKWADGKLSFTLDFAKHESIVVSGAIKDGKLAGEFSTEGFTDKWDATKK